MNTEGSHQVSGTAVDQAARQTTLQLQVDIDLTAPAITITNAPPATTSNSLVTIEAQVSDGLSGIAAVTCNGETATIASGVATCSVPLGRGRNSVVLVARDVAGNVASKGFKVERIGTPSRMAFSPDSRTMLAGEKLPISLADDFGAEVLAATWTSSDTDVIQLTNADPPYLVAVSPGTATIGATKAGLTASATVTVLAGATLQDGTTRWSIPPTPIQGIGTSEPLYTNRINDDSPAFYAVEWASSQYYTAFLRAMTSTGEQKWITEVAGNPLMADTTGGVLLGIGWSHRGGIARITPSADALPWRYESVGMTDQVVQAEGGTIYAIETILTDGINRDGSEIFDKQLLLLNGDTGAVIKRIPIPRLILTWNSSSGCGNARSEYEPEILGPVTHMDGSASLLISSYSNSRFGGCSVFDYDPREIDRGVKVWRVAPNGDLSVTDVFAQHCTLGGGASTCDVIPTLEQVVPDTAGGSYAIWSHTPLNGNAEARLSRVSVDSVVTSERVVPTSTRIAVVGDEGTVYDGASAIDEATWTPKWPFDGGPLMSLHNGGVITHDGIVLRWYNGQGLLEKSVPLVASATSSYAKQGEWLSVDQDFSFGGKPIRSIAGPIPVQTRLSSGQIISSRPLGVVQTCSDPPLQADVFDPDEPRWKGVSINHDYRIMFDRTTANSLWPSSDDEDLIVNVLFGFEIWEAANTETGPPDPTNITFTKVDDGSVDILLKQDDPLRLMNGGRPRIGETRGTANPQTGLLPNATIAWDPSVSLPIMYKKVALHEIGHVEGLAHFNEFRPGSVMNNAYDAEDFRGWVSEVVTVCDRDATRRAAIKPWVP